MLAPVSFGIPFLCWVFFLFAFRFQWISTRFPLPKNAIGECLAVNTKRLFCCELWLRNARAHCMQNDKTHTHAHTKSGEYRRGKKKTSEAKKRRKKYRKTVFMEITFWLISYLHYISRSATHFSCLSVTYRWHELAHKPIRQTMWKGKLSFSNFKLAITKTESQKVPSHAHTVASTIYTARVCVAMVSNGDRVHVVRIHVLHGWLEKSIFLRS